MKTFHQSATINALTHPSTNSTFTIKGRLQYVHLFLMLLTMLPPGTMSTASAPQILNDCLSGPTDVKSSPCRKAMFPDTDILEEIIHQPTTFENTEEEESCRRMVVDELSEIEQSIAARTSYAYWAWEQLQLSIASDSASSSTVATVDASTSEIDVNETRIRMAMREARRHYVGQGGDFDSALERFKNTLKWRQETRIDLLKACFLPTVDDKQSPMGHRTIQLSDDEAKLCAHWEHLIEEDLRIQKMAVRGYDKENRPIIVKFCRVTKWSVDVPDADEGFFITQLYIAERAIASAELRSIGKNEKLTAIFDFSSYDSGNAPPVKVMVDTIKALQANYPERLGKAVVLDAPFWMQALMQIVNPFLAPVTRDKLALVGSSTLLPRLWSNGPSAAQIRADTVTALVDPDQAMPFMLPDGHLTSPIDITHQLRNVPFYELYDSIVPEPESVATAEKR